MNLLECPDEGEVEVNAQLLTSLTVAVSNGELEERRKMWKQPPLCYSRGVLYKYARLVSSASIGAVTDW